MITNKVSDVPKIQSISNVIVTRPAPDGPAFCAALQLDGFRALYSPVMTIRMLDTKPDLDGVTAFAFTSTNGVRAFVQVGGMLSPNIRGLPVFAVGPTTAAEARAAGFENVTIAQGNVETLALLLRDQTPACANPLIYHAAGSVVKGDLAKLLEKEGLPVRRQAIYSAEPIATLSSNANRALCREPEKTAIAFFSPRSVGLFYDQLDAVTTQSGQRLDINRATALCLSAAIADAASTKNWSSVKTAHEATAQALRDLLTP